MKRIRFGLVIALLLSQTVEAYVDRTITITGKLERFDAKAAVVKTETGEVRVPAEIVKKLKYASQQYVMVPVDLGDFLDLNAVAIEKLSTVKR